MSIEIQAAWAISVFLICLRLGTLIMVSPIFAGMSGLVVFRLLFTIALAVVLVNGLGIRPHVPFTLGGLLAAACMEIAIGGTMAFGVLAAFAAFAVAGKVFDIQTGLGIGSVFDPIERAGAALSATMLNLVAVAVFFGMEGHHAFMRGIAFSLVQIPPGAEMSLLSADAVIRQFGVSFSLGMAVIAPVIFCLFLIEIVLAILARVLPQMNVLVVGVPVKIVAGVAMLALSIESISPVMGKIYAAIFTYWEQVLSHG
jgi:flagellar biosynthetic protein FliR